MTKNQFATIMKETNSEAVECGERGLTIRSGVNNRHYVIHDVEKLCDIEVDEFTQLLHGEREVIALFVMTRIVGYYSMVANWNKSKLGELRDRGLGDYALTEGGTDESDSRMENVGTGEECQSQCRVGG